MHTTVICTHTHRDTHVHTNGDMDGRVLNRQLAAGNDCFEAIC